MEDLSCFKAYDVRGELNVNFDEAICYRIGRAFAKALDAKTVVVGRDARETSPVLANSVIEGLMDEGVQVLDLGLAGTEEMYFSTTYFEADGGIEITASHNPINFNGLKMVKSESRPLDPEIEFKLVKQLAEENKFGNSSTGSRKNISLVARVAYAKKVISLVDVDGFKPLRIVVNSGNGAAGPTFDIIDKLLRKKNINLMFERILHSPDCSFPHGIPNPLLLENRDLTANAVVRNRADLGVAFDGDFDRCFFFDEFGKFIPGEYVVGLIADAFLSKEPFSKIIHDPRVVFNIQDIVHDKLGKAIQSKTGHAFIKKSMRDNDAIYGGEMSAHHYFRDFYYCDSGMIPWLLVCELLSNSNMSLGALVSERLNKFPSSGEINFKVENPKKCMLSIINYYRGETLEKDEIDGVSLRFENWRMNLRVSNTEPVVRLNVESQGDRKLLNKKITEITKLIDKFVIAE